ncbi:MAG TPA: hypothetical protein VH394_11775 [Thermoanaerobaculia bacterium]|nr:hypothetical protein [Thermoanaerobaculia bacterium]
MTPDDEAIQAASPALWSALSKLGRAVNQPVHFLPLQTAEARGKPFNATIGQITDGHGKAVPLPTLAAALGGLSDEARSRAVLYSPVEGLAELRQAWKERQAHRVPSTLPIVTVGAQQGRALVGDLFIEEGRIVVSQPDDLFGLPEGEPVVAFLEDRDALLRAAGRGPVVAVVDELFEDLVDLHENLVPIRVEEAPLQVGFLTFPFPADSAIAVALEKKVKMLLRAQVGSPSAAMQVVLLEALRQRSQSSS